MSDSSVNVLSVSACAASNMGRLRKNNEDNLTVNGKLFSEEQLAVGFFESFKLTAPFFVSVCDGMGGEENGELASKIAVDVLAKNISRINSSASSYKNVIEPCINEANEHICNQIFLTKSRLGSTVSILYAYDDIISVTNIGDSRIYHYSDNNLIQLSTDHTEVQSQINIGVISPEQAKTRKDKHKLTQHLGILREEMILEPAHKTIANIKKGDVLLLCSDGLTDMINDDEINNILDSSGTAEQAASTLMEKALANGGKDNITLIVMLVETCIKSGSEELCTKKSNILTKLISPVLILFTILMLVFTFIFSQKSKAPENRPSESNRSSQSTFDDTSSTTRYITTRTRHYSTTGKIIIEYGNGEKYSLENLSDINGIKNVENLTSLIAANKNISDISELETLENLEYLDLSKNKINSIDALDNLSKLTELNLSDNNIKYIDGISDLNNLTILDLSGNDIDDVGPLRNLTNLKRLVLSGNNLNQNEIKSLKLSLPRCRIDF